VEIGGVDGETLDPLDALIVDAGHPSIRLTSDGRGSIFVIRIRHIDRND
jgi:hypothetical protein